MSTDSEEQLTSYAAQISYYTEYIKGREDWEFVGVYTDEGISGCSTKRREGFQRMISDAMAGKIDLIITKSVSRFARNTVDTLVTTRELKILESKSILWKITFGQWMGMENLDLR